MSLQRQKPIFIVLFKKLAPILFVFMWCMGCLPHNFFGQDTLQQKIEILSTNPFFKNGTLGVSVRDAGTGELLASINADSMLVPASGMKLITTLSGYHLLGREFCFATSLQYDGQIMGDGTLRGNIYIQGSGDPTLGSDRIKGNPDGKELFGKLIRDMQHAGIYCVEGDIIADPTIFRGHPVHASWKSEDLGNYYAAGAWGLNFNENQYHIYYNTQGRIGSKSSIVRVEPEIPGLEFNNIVKINRPGTGDRANIYGGPFEFKKKITGTVPKSRSPFRIKGAIPDPPGYLAATILRQMNSHDMGGYSAKVDNRPSFAYGGQKVISTHWSPPLADIVRQTNVESVNIYAESIIKTIGYLSEGQGDEYFGGKAIKKFMHQLQLDTVACSIADGSGLSLHNRITPSCMSGFLIKMIPLIGIDTLINLIPEAGREGTVKSLLLHSPAKGSMWVKSGSMKRVLSYTGYCKTASGKLVSFSVMLNQRSAASHARNKKELEKILDAIYRFS
jgi:D-alanyl-D-alanine carboxypeptidase/D-alanyl-D-alanine-endopeptidase (penicillin-binding protein 4)